MLRLEALIIPILDKQEVYVLAGHVVMKYAWVWENFLIICCYCLFIVVLFYTINMKE